jgi:hypothetical protein
VGDKFLDGAVIGSFGFGGKETSGQFPGPAVIDNAFAADAFPGAGLIGAVALFKIDGLFAFHIIFLRKKSTKFEFRNSKQIQMTKK